MSVVESDDYSWMVLLNNRGEYSVSAQRWWDTLSMNRKNWTIVESGISHAEAAKITNLLNAVSRVMES